MATISKSVERQ